MKDWPGGSYIVMKSNTRVTGGIKLVEIGYKYNYRKVLCFIYTKVMEVMNHVIPIYLVTLKFILMFLFFLTF